LNPSSPSFVTDCQIKERLRHDERCRKEGKKISNEPPPPGEINQDRKKMLSHK